ncbi:SGNH/GDSL hydrolase family protein [Roseiconus lacunae]|uniref:SGNH/GDSL hydrolase family protein n=1 Tax=Roseiconus lacunae TaxID=2605694 RepID=A0ABT7PMJ3_9BACT|nr:SGNH/GDSL hydrolase family protein [Roseiconus lacunae]MCD0458059.1 SGNH/GDSL hydrolase family protein [Roseiconus lacunae]MDM4017501.1 SGNH/GDSL hydrolase family protein [Roseiconus lacunae]WRQ53750.1 SGNH/GDSL hydrolase family protein [Stieleria sp. HD01]
MKRRTFIAATASAGAIGCLSNSHLPAAEKMSLSKGDVILFQGDSITDAGRNKKSPVANEGLGNGYPKFIAQSLQKDYADLDLQIHNRGISGNKVPDLDKRWQDDCIAIEPKILSILIGVNDIWHRLNGRYDGTAETYRDGFAALLKRTRKALPKTTFVICEPFVLMSGTVKDNEDRWFPEFATRRDYAKQVATEAGAIWVPFQTMFDKAVADGTAPQDLARDGVHPTQQGHQLMAQTWRDVVGI